MAKNKQTKKKRYWLTVEVPFELLERLDAAAEKKASETGEPPKRSEIIRVSLREYLTKINC